MLSNILAEQKGADQVPASAAGPCHRAPQSSLYQEQLAKGCRETSREETESGDRPQPSDFEKGMNEGTLRQMSFDPTVKRQESFGVNPSAICIHMCTQQGNVEYMW